MLLSRELLLVLAIAVLAMAPLLERWLHRRALWRELLDGLLLVWVGGLVAVHLVPDSVRLAGGWAVLALLAGFSLPLLLERGGGVAARHTHVATLLVALLGLALHATLDGMALAAPGHLDPNVPVLGLAVVGHRLPMGLFIWVKARPNLGPWRAAGVLALVALATVVGFGLGSEALHALDGRATGIFQALVAGTLLHVLIHRPEVHDHTHRRLRVAQTAGGALGVILILFTAEALAIHDHAAPSGFGDRFLDLAVLGAPALIVGYVASGLLHWSAATGLGPWFGRWLKFGQARDRLVSVPALVFSVPLLGVPLTIARLVVGGILQRALAVLGRTLPDGPVEPTNAAGHGTARAGLRAGLIDAVDRSAAWVVLGLVLAAAVSPVWLVDWLATQGEANQVVIFAFLGLPIAIGATGATPLAAVSLYAGASPGAVIAFLLTAPMRTAGLLGQTRKQSAERQAWLAPSLVLALAVPLGLLTNALVGQDAVPSAPTAADSAGTLVWVALGSVAGLFLFAVLRRGPVEIAQSVLGGKHEHVH